MASVPIGELRPGAVLAAAVTGAGGRELAPAGEPLSDRHIQILRAWGVTSVDLAQAAKAGPDKAAMAAAQRMVAPRFRGQPVEHPAVRALFAIAVARRLNGKDR